MTSENEFMPSPLVVTAGIKSWRKSVKQSRITALTDDELKKDSVENGNCQMK